MSKFYYKQSQWIFLTAVLLGLLNITSVNAQKIEVQWSPEFEEEKGEKLGHVLYRDTEFIYVYVSKTNKKGKDTVTPGLIKFDRKMQMVKREDYQTTAEDMIMEGTTYFGGNFLMLSSHRDKKTNTINIYGTIIDPNTLKVKGNPVTLYTLTAPKKIDLDWEWEVSSDSATLLLYASAEQKNDEQRKLGFKIYDKDLKVINERLVILDQTVENSRIIEAEVTTQGDVYLLGKSYKNGSKKEIKRENGEKAASYTLILKRFNKDGTIKDFNIPMGKNVLENADLYPDPITNDLYLLGTHQNVDLDGIVGYFFIRIDSKTGNIVAENQNLFDLPFINKVNDMNDDKNKSKKEHPGISSTYEITTFRVLPNGKMLAIFEENYTIVSTYRCGNSYCTKTTHYSKGIIPIAMDKDGKQEWINFIPKVQVSSGTKYYMGYSEMYHDNKMMIMYNDHSSNLKKDLKGVDEPKPMTSYKEMSFVMVTIDEKGAISRKELSNSEEMDTVAYIDGSKQISASEFIIYGYKFRKQINKLGLAVFN